MPVYMSATVRASDLVVQFYTTDDKYLVRAGDEIEKKYKGTLRFSTAISGWILASGFKDEHEMDGYALWLMNLLKRDGWEIDAYNDARHPDSHHFKRG